jgi:uncharacterized protein with HEPN domain
MADRLGNRIRLQHIIDAIDEIFDYTFQMDFDTFSQNSMCYNACLKQLEIIGEAANKVDEDIQKANPHIIWRQIIGLRNQLVHGYFGIDKVIVWEVIQEHLSPLKADILLILVNLPNT